MKACFVKFKLKRIDWVIGPHPEYICPEDSKVVSVESYQGKLFNPCKTNGIGKGCYLIKECKVANRIREDLRNAKKKLKEEL